jgi:hypothetical protein
MLTYTTPDRPRGAETKIEIDGRVLLFTPTKQASVILPVFAEGDLIDRQIAAGGAMFDWIGRGLSDEDNEWLKTRLLDEDDSFDIADLTALATMLFEQAAKLPSSPSLA